MVATRMVLATHADMLMPAALAWSLAISITDGSRETVTFAVAMTAMVAVRAPRPVDLDARPSCRIRLSTDHRGPHAGRGLDLGAETPASAGANRSYGPPALA